MKALPLLLVVQDVDDAAAVTLQCRGIAAATLGALRAGDWVNLTARLHSVTFRGGYHTTHGLEVKRGGATGVLDIFLAEDTEPEAPAWIKEQRRNEGPEQAVLLTLDTAEIFLTGELGTLTHNATIRHVQYDGGGDWIDLDFSDGRRIRFKAAELYHGVPCSNQQEAEDYQKEIDLPLSRYSRWDEESR